MERSHRSLQKKINFDLIYFSKVGVHWVSKLMDYQKVLNEESMDVSGKQWTCEVFYGRTSNGERVRKIQSKAKPSNSVWDKRYIKRRIKGNPPSIYKVGERVLI